MGAANSDDFREHLEELERSCFRIDLDCRMLGHQLHHVNDALRIALPEVRQATNIATMCEAFDKTSVTTTLQGEVHIYS